MIITALFLDSASNFATDGLHSPATTLPSSFLVPVCFVSIPFLIMVTENQEPTCLIVGNYCHDVLIKDDVVIAESLGGAASFVSQVLDGLAIPSCYVSKVGSDFSYSVNHEPIVVPSSNTTLFHAHFSSEIKRQDRILKRVSACEPILPSDLPVNSKFSFGLAAGVGGEILPETLEKILQLCRLVFVDIQALIRLFDPIDGAVRLINLKETEFFHLLPKIAILKASADEVVYIDLEEVRKLCCVVVTNGKDGSTVYWKDGELQIAPFPTVQVDPTGAGDSFLGGLISGLYNGLSIPDAALLGNFFGSLTVGQLGLPKFDLWLLQRVKDELETRTQHLHSIEEGQDDGLDFVKPLDHEKFHTIIDPWRLTSGNPELQLSPRDEEHHKHHHCNGQHQQEVLVNSVYEEDFNSSET